MEQSLGKLTDAEIIAEYRKAELKYGGTNMIDAEVIASCKILKSRYGINMFYKPEENLFAACYNSSNQLKILGYYKTFEEAENRLHNLFGEMIDKIDKEITENEHYLRKTT